MIIERMGNLNAIYFPNTDYGQMYENMTPVNTFRIIFNEYFDKDYKLLDDKNFWSNSDKPYQYIDVTDIIKQLYT